jgi:capsular polysaccharide biosynthesis protein
MTPHLMQRTSPDGIVDQPVLTRTQIIYRARFSIVGVAILIATAAWAVSAFMPGTYSAQSDVLVTSKSAMTSMDAVNGANDLATQYAQFAVTEPVMTDASARTGVPMGELAGSTVVSTVSSTNIVRVTASAGSVGEAGKRATAVADALVAQAEKRMTVAAAADPAQLKVLDDLLAQAKADVVRLTASLGAARPGSSRAVAGTTLLNNAQQQVLALTLKRIDLVNQSGQGSGGGRGVSLSRLTDQPATTKVSPRPLLYATVALISSLVVMTELAVASERRRIRSAGARPRRPSMAG